MEPKTLLIGKNLDTLSILGDELKKFKRNVYYANSEEMINNNLKNEKIDLIIMGAGLPDTTISEMLEFINTNFPKIEKHIMKKVPGLTPVSMIGYTNEKAIMWRLMNTKKIMK